ncbi:MAG: 2-dehydropantoate 2-reductase [Polyangiaceae bacterium]|nr:2-dehydropantoate 2-reductase [Polyangiaceae bacterium]
MSARFLVVGAGGIGGVVSAHLNEQGHDALTLTKNAIIADAVNANGFRVRGDSAPGTVRGRAVESLPKTAGKFDYVLLATQPPQVEEAAHSIVSHLADDGRVVCLQNGLCEERVEKIVGTERVIGAVVAWGASMIEPGLYDRTSAGGFQIGRFDGADDPRLAELAQVLECIGPTVTTKNLRGSRWSKLAINCAISSLGTVGGDRLGVLMRQRHVRRLALEIMTEVTAVAQAAGVQLEKVSGTIDLEWIALTPAERSAGLGSASLVAKHALLLAVGARYRRLRSSMLSAIERGRVPAIEFLNGEVTTRGAELGVATPINAAIRDEVLRIAAGKAKSSHELLRSFYDRTRDLLASPPESLRPVPQTLVVDRAPATLESPPLAEGFAQSEGEARSIDETVDSKVAKEPLPESAAPATTVDPSPARTEDSDTIADDATTESKGS